MKYSIPDESLDNLLRTISRETRVKGIVLYVSRAKGTFRNGSDIDLCLDATELDYQTLMSIENELDDLLLPWKIGLAIRQRIDNAELLSHIERVGKTLYRRGAE